MEKPITMVIDDFKMEIVNAINNAKIPMWVVRDVMADFARQTAEIANNEAKAEREAYEASLSNSKEEE